MLLFQEIPSVLGASKYEQKVTEAPSAVSIVTAEEIKKYGYRTLGEILQSVRSFHLTYDRSLQQVGVRGFNRPGDSNSRILLLINGHRRNDNIFGAGEVDTAFLLDVDLIDRVEIIRGPSSSLYGTNAFFAVVNVITRRGRDLQGVEVAGEAGTHETYRGRGTYGNRFGNGLELLLSGTVYDSEGNHRVYFSEFDTPENNNGTAVDCDGDKFTSFFGKASLLDFTLEGGYIDREKHSPTAPYGTVFNDARNKGESRKGYAVLSYEHLFPGKWTVQANVSYNYFHQDGDYIYDYSLDETPFLVVNKDRFRGEWWEGELQVTKQLGERNKLIFGGDYQDNFRQDQKNYDLDVYLNAKNSSKNWGIYGQDEFQVFSGLIFNLGIRYDHYDTFGGTTNPRLALIFNPIEKTTLKLLYGTAFRAPNAFELYYNDGLATQKPNPDLDAEKIKTYEAVWEQYLGDHLRSVAAVFYYKINNLINFTFDESDGLLLFDNIDTVETKGIELELEGKWNGGYEGRISYTYQKAEDKNTDEVLSNSPKHLAKLNLIVPVIENRLFLGMEEQYTSRRKTIYSNHTGGYAVTNLTLFSRGLLPGLEVSASVYNLFEENYGDPASAAFLQETIEQDGRVFRFKLAYLF